MPRSATIPIEDFEKHYRAWVEEHPGAIPYDKFTHCLVHGDEFGEKLSILRLARLTKTTRNTMYRWIPACLNELRQRGFLPAESRV